MKKLEQLVDMRSVLRYELEKHQDLKSDLTAGRKYAELNDEEKKEYFYISNVISGLRIQINTLTYVINHDSELIDVTKRPKIMHT